MIAKKDNDNERWITSIVTNGWCQSTIISNVNIEQHIDVAHSQIRELGC